jgi:hypothetical protein
VFCGDSIPQIRLNFECKRKSEASGSTGLRQSFKVKLQSVVKY